MNIRQDRITKTKDLEGKRIERAVNNVFEIILEFDDNTKAVFIPRSYKGGPSAVLLEE